MKYWSLLLTFLLIPTSLYADDAELYDPKPPADSAFVRIANGFNGEALSTIGQTEYGTIGYAGLSDYRIIKAGTYEATVGAAKSSLDITAGHYYTVASTSSQQLVVFDEELLENPSKAKIYFFNLSDAANASLYAPDFKADIVKAVASNGYQAKDINAVKLKVEVKSDDHTIQTFDDVELKRRSGVSFVLTGSDNNYKTTMVNNRVAR